MTKLESGSDLRMCEYCKCSTNAQSRACCNAGRDIDALQAKLEAYRWIPVGERLPDTNREVNVTSSKGMWDDSYLPDKAYWRLTMDGVITHWRERILPETE